MSVTEFNQRKETPINDLFGGSEWDVYDTSILNLSVGAPGPDLLQNCCKIFEEATKHRMSYEASNLSTLFQYGPTLGRVDFRKTLSKFLTEEYKGAVHSEDLVVTSGASQGLHLILSTLVDLSGVVFVDEVTYMLALETIKLFSTMQIVSVPMTSCGTDIAALKQLTSKYKFKSKDKMYWACYYTIPTYHNPTGRLFSEENRQQLIELSRENDFLIVCDDVYNLLNYSKERIANPPKRLFAFDDLQDKNYRGNVISNGSFSKILSPALRLGWMECPPRCVDVFRVCGVLRSGGAANNYTSGIVNSLIELGLAKEYLNRICNIYQERMHVACKTLRDNLPEPCSFVEPDGGFFIWIKLADNVNAKAFNDYCLRKYRVFGIAGSTFSIENKFENCLRITVGFHNVDNLEKGIRMLCNAYREFIEIV